MDRLHTLAAPNNRWKPKTPAERFLEKVIKRGPDECWDWSGYKKKWGYGILGIAGRTELATRISWELHHGPIQEGMNVLHKCDNPPCCNPAHLFLGTQRENTRDAMNKGRHCTLRGEQHGNAKFTDAEIETIRSSCLTSTELAGRFSVNVSTINRIRNKTAWKHK